MITTQLSEWPKIIKYKEGKEPKEVPKVNKYNIALWKLRGDSWEKLKEIRESTDNTKDNGETV